MKILKYLNTFFEKTDILIMNIFKYLNMKIMNIMKIL